jgi:hypothetical protein
MSCEWGTGEGLATEGHGRSRKGRGDRDSGVGTDEAGGPGALKQFQKEGEDLEEVPEDEFDQDGHGSFSWVGAGPGRGVFLGAQGIPAPCLLPVV